MVMVDETEGSSQMYAELQDKEAVRVGKEVGDGRIERC